MGLLLFHIKEASKQGSEEAVGNPVTDFEVEYSEESLFQLRGLDIPVSKRIYEKVDALSQNPERYVEKLVRYPYYRLRVGDYRVILGKVNGRYRVLRFCFELLLLSIG